MRNKAHHARIFSLLLVIGILIGLGTIAVAQTVTVTVAVNVKSTYLRTNEDPNSVAAVPIDLNALGIAPGSQLQLEQLGAFQYYEGCPGCNPPNPPLPDEAAAMVGVFSSTNTLLPASQLDRVPGAIALNANQIVTGPTLMGGLPMDIPQDFWISNGSTRKINVLIPAGAKYLFVSPNDSFYGDNGDPNHDYAVRIRSVKVRKLYQGDGVSTLCPTPGGDPPWGPCNFGPDTCKKGESTVRCTFQSSACVVTALTMAMNYVLEKDFNSTGQTLTSKALHDDFLAGSAFTSDGLVAPETAVPAYFYYTFRPFTWKPLTGTTTTQLSAALANGYPVFVRVNNDHHTILVTGIDHSSPTPKFRIADPGRRANQYLDAFGNTFIIKGYIKPKEAESSRFATLSPPSDIKEFSGDVQTPFLPSVNPAETNSLSVSVGEKAGVLVIDPVGRRTGFDPSTQQPVNEIPDSHYDDEFNIDPFTLDPLDSAPLVRTVGIANPIAGNYQVVIYGITTGTFRLDIKRVDSSGKLRASTFSGNIQAGSTVNNSFVYSTNFAPYDYDGDAKTDISIFRPSVGQWYLLRSQAGLYGVGFGANGDRIAPADYDGDGKTDVAVYRPSNGVWYVLNSSNSTVSYFVFGAAEDLPTPADYDGDGKADLSVFRPSSGTWFRLNSSNNSFFGYQFGANGDRPALGDFDGDGKADISIYRPTDGTWYRVNSGNGTLFGTQFGSVGDLHVPADYDGDGKTEVSVFRPSNGVWYRLNSGNGAFVGQQFGLNGDIPAPGDYEGDGKADVCVFRPSDGNWYRLNSSNNVFVAQPFGANGDLPTPAAYR